MGHTHEDIDAIFGVFSKFLDKLDVYIIEGKKHLFMAQLSLVVSKYMYRPLCKLICQILWPDTFCIKLSPMSVFWCLINIYLVGDLSHTKYHI